MTFEQLPHMAFVLGEDGQLRTLMAGEDPAHFVSGDWNAIDLTQRVLFVRGTPGGRLNANATLLAGRPVFGDAILSPDRSVPACVNYRTA